MSLSTCLSAAACAALVLLAASPAAAAAARAASASPASPEPPAHPASPAPSASRPAPRDFVSLADVIPDAVMEIRYATAHNFTGDPVPGYDEPLALCTLKSAQALARAADELRAKGFRIKIYDAYRPKTAVARFIAWAADADDLRMKAEFYPEEEKSRLFAQGFIAKRSGHSRGSTFDLTLVDAATGRDVDMGGTFDYFGPRSRAACDGITAQQKRNRTLLHTTMERHGFRGISSEWWHFTLAAEPYASTYFDFPVRADVLAGGRNAGAAPDAKQPRAPKEPR